MLTQKWEYCAIFSNVSLGREGWKAQVVYSRDGAETFEEAGNSSHLISTLNRLGADGWELVGISNEVTSMGSQTLTKFFLKRAK